MKKEVKYRKSSWWKKFKERVASFLTAKRKEEEKRKAERATNAPDRDKSWRILEDCSFSLCFWDRIGFVSMLQQKDCRKGKESRWVEEIPQRWRQPKGEDRTKMKKEAKLLRCTLLLGSAWSTKRKSTKRYKGKCDVFFGIEHRERKEEMVEQFNKEAKEGWRFAAGGARFTDERADIEDQKHTSGGVFVAIDSNVGAVVGEKETSVPGNAGRILQA